MAHTVVHFLDADTYGGCEEVILMLLAGLDRREWRPILFHHAKPGIVRLLNEVSRLGIPCRAVPSMTGRNRVATLRQFVREVRVAEPTIFHAHLNWPLGCRYGVMAAKLSRVPAIVATSHVYFPILEERFGWLKQHLHAASIDRYIAVSNEVKERLCQDLQVPELKVRVVRNGVRLAPFAQAAESAFRAKLTGRTECPIVFTSARLHSQKGHVYLLEAAALVPNALFILAGDGPERQRLEELSRKLGLEARVRFLGHRQDVAKLLASCDLFVLPSLYEGLPLSVLEAMAAGKPVVATAVGGTDEAVVHGATGLLVPPGDSAELAAAIRTMLSERALAARLAEAGKVRAMRMFSSETMVREVTRVYEDLIRANLLT